MSIRDFDPAFPAYPVMDLQRDTQHALPNKGWLPCPFCGGTAIESHWPDHRGCANPTCGAHKANLTFEQWNQRPSKVAGSKESDHTDPFKRCQHDLNEVGTTIVVDGIYDAKCMCCLQEWHLPPISAPSPPAQHSSDGEPERSKEHT